VSPNPTPLTARQLSALVAVSFRELSWVLPNVRREVRRWRQHASSIPDAGLRADAVETLRRERLNTEGAALFAVVPRRRSLGLLRLLVAYQVTLDYLDSISERPCADPLANGRQLHRALVEALDPSMPVSDYYRHHPERDDGGYLRALVGFCREQCVELPGWAEVRERVGRSARHGTVQVLNHDPDDARRERALVAWAEREFGARDDAAWFELTASASSSLWTLALLALAGDGVPQADELERAASVYVPWICGASTLLDAFVDQAEDAAAGNHNYLAHYRSEEVAGARLAEIVRRSAGGARELPRGTRHALVTAGMVSMYLAKDAAREPALRDGARSIRRAAGTLPLVQLPIMRVMRAVRGLGAA
jgi:tetraprenyl-beta-curcumene synthase